MIFNVAELLPENRRDPELEMCLKKIGFPYRYERKLVDADREETIRLVREAQARNEARIAQENAEWEARQKEHELRIAEEQKKQAELERQAQIERQKQEAKQKRQVQIERQKQEELKREAKERQARIDAEKQRTEMERQQELKRKRQEEATRQAEQQRRRSKQAHQAAAEEDWQFEVIGDKINAAVQRFVRDLLKILF